MNGGLPTYDHLQELAEVHEAFEPSLERVARNFAAALEHDVEMGLVGRRTPNAGVLGDGVWLLG